MHLYVLVAIYADSAERRRFAQEQVFIDLKELFNDLKICLQGNFALTKEQMVHLFRPLFELWLTIIGSFQANIRKAANDLVYQATWTSFTTMHVNLDVWQDSYIFLATLTDHFHLRHIFKNTRLALVFPISSEVLLVSKSWQVSLRGHVWVFEMHSGKM